MPVHPPKMVPVYWTHPDVRVKLYQLISLISFLIIVFSIYWFYCYTRLNRVNPPFLLIRSSDGCWRASTTPTPPDPLSWFWCGSLHRAAGMQRWLAPSDILVWCWNLLDVFTWAPKCLPIRKMELKAHMFPQLGIIPWCQFRIANYWILFLRPVPCGLLMWFVAGFDQFWWKKPIVFSQLPFAEA